MKQKTTADKVSDVIGFILFIILGVPIIGTFFFMLYRLWFTIIHEIMDWPYEPFFH